MGVALPEMDLDAMLARKPQIVLVDELAHTNAPGSRHEKRWQDVEELLDAGHRRLHHGQYPALREPERRGRPDHRHQRARDRPGPLLDQAVEIKLVDIPPEELLQRCRRARSTSPIRPPGHREVFPSRQPDGPARALPAPHRRPGGRPDAGLHGDQSIAGPWPTAERLLVCVSGSPSSERLIRATCRLAEELKAAVVHGLHRNPEGGQHVRENRERVWQNLQPGRRLGGPGGELSRAAT